MNIGGIDYRLDWGEFTEGRSFFVPCLDVEDAKGTLTTMARLKGVKILMQVEIEDNIRGIRVWNVGKIEKEKK